MSFIADLLTVVATKSNPYVGGALTLASVFLKRKKERASKMLEGKKTYIGIMVAVAPTVAKLFGYDMGTEGQEQLGVALNEIFVMVGGLIAMYGRLKAKPIAKKG